MQKQRWVTEDEARQGSTEDTKEHEDRERDAWEHHNAEATS